MGGDDAWNKFIWTLSYLEMKEEKKKRKWIGEFAPNLGHDPNNPFPLKNSQLTTPSHQREWEKEILNALLRDEPMPKDILAKDYINTAYERIIAIARSLEREAHQQGVKETIEEIKMKSQPVISGIFPNKLQRWIDLDRTFGELLKNK